MPTVSEVDEIVNDNSVQFLFARLGLPTSPSDLNPSLPSALLEALGYLTTLIDLALIPTDTFMSRASEHTQNFADEEAAYARSQGENMGYPLRHCATNCVKCGATPIVGASSLNPVDPWPDIPVRVSVPCACLYMASHAHATPPRIRPSTTRVSSPSANSFKTGHDTY